MHKRLDNETFAQAMNKKNKQNNHLRLTHDHFIDQAISSTEKSLKKPNQSIYKLKPIETGRTGPHVIIQTFFTRLFKKDTPNKFKTSSEKSLFVFNSASLEDVKKTIKLFKFIRVLLMVLKAIFIFQEKSGFRKMKGKHENELSLINDVVYFDKTDENVSNYSFIANKTIRKIIRTAKKLSKKHLTGFFKLTSNIFVSKT